MKEGISIRRLYAVDDSDNLHMVTLAVEDIPTENKNTIRVKVATAVCSPKDKPNKKLGAEIATGRLLVGKCFMTPILSSEDFLPMVKKGVSHRMRLCRMYHLPNIGSEDLYTKAEIMQTKWKHKLVPKSKKKAA